MADRRFFMRAGPFSLTRIAEAARIALPHGADGTREFSDVAALDAAGAEDLSFLDNTKYADAFRASRAGACFVRAKYAGEAPRGMVVLECDDPYTAYARAARLFYPEAPVLEGVAASAHIDPSARLGSGVRVEPGAVVGARAEIGARCLIGANAVIGEGVVLGEDTRIGANAVVSHAVIGSRVVVYPGVKIGQDGFGYAPSRDGIVKVPQLGRVLIGDEVEIGANACIDRGAGPDTVIGRGAKIDNLVQIAHNCTVGAYAIITAQVGIAGSTRIGAGAQLGGQAGIAGHLSIGDGAKIAARSGVMRDVPPGETQGGFPAVPIRDWHRQSVALMEWVKKGGKRDE